MTEEWEDSFNTIKSLHDEAYSTIEQAIKHEEDSQPSLVIKIQGCLRSYLNYFILKKNLF